MSDRTALQGRTIVITRPAHQASAISQRLQERGAHVVRFPLLDIAEPMDVVRCHQQLSTLSRYDYLIFTSPNAVEYAFAKLPEALPPSLNIAAVGKKTAEALACHGVSVSIVPDRLFNSEALLACPAFQSVRHQSIAIIRGEGGRELLRDTLRQRGAVVNCIEVYRRVCPVDDLSPLTAIHQQAGIDLIVLTSVESLYHLFRLGAGLRWLNETPLLVGSERIAHQARRYARTGEVVVATDPSDDSIYHALCGAAHRTLWELEVKVKELPD
ncbi:MAG: uroporphyrinogen III synthase [Proteobacteria bacterium]|nr:MAG: uroporphyrinogen III synthase [Pseudomonadota bacterium]